MFSQEAFLELGLHVVELPPEYVEEKLTYKVFLKELPFLIGTGSSKLSAYQALTERYTLYREEYLQEHPELQEKEEETTELLDIQQLLRYYDGEVFDGFEWKDKE